MLRRPGIQIQIAEDDPPSAPNLVFRVRSDANDLLDHDVG